MTLENGPLLEEHVLRRALRLDADEMPLRLDAALIAGAARASAGRPRELVLAIVVAFLGGWLWSEAFRAILGSLVPAVIDPMATAIQIVAAVSIAAVPIVDAATHPVIPIAILTTALVALFFEQRGRAHAASS